MPSRGKPWLSYGMIAIKTRTTHVLGPEPSENQVLPDKPPSATYLG